MKLPHDNDQFRILVEGNERLVLPAMGVGNASWQKWEDRWYRSLHTDSSGKIISCGFPKFMNIGEGTPDFQITKQNLFDWIGKKKMYATLKIDGSLLIRYVQDNKVKWRTRGAFGVGLPNAYEIDYFMDKYPDLADPTLCENGSVLFEWVSPENKIVIGYDEPELYLIGSILHKETPLLTNWDFTLGYGSFFQVPSPECYSLNNANDMIVLDEKLRQTGIEGFVIRIEDNNDDIRMVKMKTESYIAMHALKSKLTTSLLVDLWQSWNRPTFNEYQENFIAAYDFECWEWAQGAVSNMYEGIKIADKSFGHLILFVEINRNLSRKEFALRAQQAYNGVKLSTAFQILDGKEITNEAWKKLILQNCKQVEMNMI